MYYVGVGWVPGAGGEGAVGQVREHPQQQTLILKNRIADHDIELIYDFISFYISTLLIASPGLGALAYYLQSLRSRGLVTFQLGVPINFVSNLG